MIGDCIASGNHWGRRISLIFGTIRPVVEQQLDRIVLAYPDGTTVGVKVGDGRVLELVSGDVGAASAVAAVQPFIDVLYLWAGALGLVSIVLAWGASRDDSLAPVGTKTQASTPARSAPTPTSHPAATTATTTSTATTLASTATHVRVRTFTEAYSPVVARKAGPSPEKVSLPSSGVM